MPDCVHNTNMKRTNYYFPEPLIARLRLASKKADMPMAEIIRRALEEYLNKRGFK
jgi:predicted DNA-binding protein